jgi:hypothetical protein
MKKTMAFLVIALLSMSLFAEPQIKDLYLGTWTSGNASVEISEGTTGLIVKYTKPRDDPAFVIQGQAPASPSLDLYGAAYVYNGVLMIQISGTNLAAAITKDGQLLIGGQFFKHE